MYFHWFYEGVYIIVHGYLAAPVSRDFLIHRRRSFSDFQHLLYGLLTFTVFMVWLLLINTEYRILNGILSSSAGINIAHSNSYTGPTTVLFGSDWNIRRLCLWKRCKLSILAVVRSITSRLYSSRVVHISYIFCMTGSGAIRWLHGHRC